MLESDVQLGSSRAYPGVRVPGASKEAQEGHRGPVAQARDAELGGGASGRGRRGGVGTARGRGGAVGGVRAQPSPRRRLGVAGDGDPVVVVCALPAQPRHAFLRGDRSFWAELQGSLDAFEFLGFACTRIAVALVKFYSKMDQILSVFLGLP
jgi:hypothetical protein